MSTGMEALKAAQADAQNKLAETESALAEITAGVKAMKKDPEANHTVAMFRKMVAESTVLVEKITASVASAERLERTKTIVDPLIAQFGVLTVAEATEFRIEFVDIPSTLAKLTAAANAINSKIHAINALSAACDTLAISEETAADLKAVKFVAASPTSYKLEMARTGTRAASTGGTRTSTSGQIFTITEAAPGFAQLVGVKIGKGQDHETWRELVKNTDIKLFTGLEAKRLGTDGSGKKSNYSAAVIAERKFGVKYTSETTAPAPAAS